MRVRSPWHVRTLLWLGAILLVLVLMLALAGLGLLRYTQSSEFHERVRQFAVARIERVTGGRVELQSVEWNLARLQFELAGLKLHGREAVTASPLLRVEQVQMRVKWTPLLVEGHIRLHELRLLRPMAHVEVYKDGSTNIPAPALKQATGANATADLLRLAMDHAELSDGLLEWNEDKIKLNGMAEQVVLDLSYNAADQRYDAVAKVGQISMRLPQVEPLILSAEANFRLYHDRVEVPRLRVTSGNSWVEAGGALTGLASPVAQFSYRAVGDLANLARLIRYHELRGGAVQLSGEGTYRWDRAEYAVVGGARAAGVSWVNPNMSLQNINGGFAYSLGRDRFNVSSIFATTLGGTVHGTLEAGNLSGKDPTGRIALEVNGIELAQALRAFSTGELPLDRLHLAGSTAGTLEMNWRGALRNARMNGALRIEPLRRAGELPVSAVVQATVDFNAQTAQLHSAEVSTPASHLSAHGSLSANSELKLELTTTDLSELAPMVTSWRGPRARELPIELAGRAQFHGTFQGRPSQPELAGHLELHEFTTTLRGWRKRLPGAQVIEPLVRTRWDLLDGDVEYSATRETLHNATLRRGGARIGVDASVALVNGNYDATQPFTAHVRLENVAAADLQGLVGSNYPVTGQVNADVQVRGTTSHLNGRGRIAITDGTAWSQVVRSATASVSFTENQALLRNIVVRSDVAQLSGEAHINVETSEFGFELKGTEVKLENLRVVREGKIPVTGQAAFEASGAGTPAAPVINGHLRLRNLTLQHQTVGDLDVDAVTRGAEMTLTARSRFKAAEFKLDGQVHLRDQMPIRLTADLQSANLNPLIEAYLPLRHAAASELKMHIDAAGELRRPKDITADVVVESWVTNYGGIAISNDGPIRLHMANEIVRVEQFRIAGEQGTRFLQVSGQMQMGGKRELDLHAEGSLNLKLLETADSNLMAGGVANLDLQVRGTLSRPFMSGRLNVQNATIKYIDFPNGLSDITGTLVFNEDRLQVQELTARTGGGLLHCGGFITFSPSQGLGFNLSANGREIRLRYPEGLSSTADLSFTLTGSMKNALLSGNVTVTRLGLNPQFDFANYLALGMRGAPAQKINSPLNNVHMDVHVTSTPELQVQTALARLSGNVDLRLRGTASRPIVLGRVNLLEGTIYFNSTKYRMERGDVIFNNPVRIEPALDVEISARVRDYDITLGFHGPINKLTPSYRSDPPLSSSDIISLLALGRTAEESGNPAMMGTAQYQPAVSESASSSLIGQALNATANSRAQRLFGVSRVKIDPNVGGALNAGLARVTVEQQASNNMTITYITNLTQSAQQIIQVEYNLNKDVSIVGVRDQTGVVSFVVLLRKRRK
ncbi:MAG: translocation/assembly module TamB domain-containing protein [Candidatus Korobacteraceae bacterium]